MRRKVFMHASPDFYALIERERAKAQKNLGLKRKISISAFTEMAVRGGIKFPIIKTDVMGLKNVKRKKGRLY